MRALLHTLISSLPVPRMKPASVLPMPVANCPNAPALHVCESVPKSTSPAPPMQGPGLCQLIGNKHPRCCVQGNQLKEAPGLQWPSWASATWHTPL